MFFGAFLSRILGVENYQTRAIALETGLQNSSLAMIFAILLQDQMGDFHSSMFFTSGIFGLWMYFAGAVMILLFRAWLPITREQEAEAEAAHP
jgi:predicted Na+-dependent transporter